MPGITELRRKIERIDAALRPSGGVHQFLATTGIALVVQGNERDRLAGIDQAGRALVPLAASTLEDRRRHGDPPGPPLLRRRKRLITEFRAVATSTGSGVRIDSGWPGLDWVRHHRAGSRRLPRRAVGMSEDTRGTVRLAFRDYVAERFLP